MCHLQNTFQERDDILTDDCGQALQRHVIDKTPKVPQLLQGAFGVNKLPL